MWMISFAVHPARAYLLGKRHSIHSMIRVDTKVRPCKNSLTLTLSLLADISPKVLNKPKYFIPAGGPLE